jgi:hypothetical protein
MVVRRLPLFIPLVYSMFESLSDPDVLHRVQ